MKGLRGFDFGETLLVFWLVLWLAGLVGWCMNLYKLVTICCEPTGWLFLRGVGVVVLPLGAIV
jgi:hypothetical protein